MDQYKIKYHIGSWAFFIGVILAVLLGILITVSTEEINAVWTWLLVVLGVVIGFLNVTEKETDPFLFAAIALIVASFFTQEIITTSPVLSNILLTLLTMFGPATIVVALKRVMRLSHQAA